MHILDLEDSGWHKTYLALNQFWDNVNIPYIENRPNTIMISQNFVGNIDNTKYKIIRMKIFQLMIKPIWHFSIIIIQHSFLVYIIWLRSHAHANANW